MFLQTNDLNPLTAFVLNSKACTLSLQRWHPLLWQHLNLMHSFSFWSPNFFGWSTEGSDGSLTIVTMNTHVHKQTDRKACQQNFDKPHTKIEDKLCVKQANKLNLHKSASMHGTKKSSLRMMEQLIIVHLMRTWCPQRSCCVGSVVDDRLTHSATRTCPTNAPRDAKPILDFEVILQFRSSLISLFLQFDICYQQCWIC